jgi:hypothetical protein
MLTALAAAETLILHHIGTTVPEAKECLRAIRAARQAYLSHAVRLAESGVLSCDESLRILDEVLMPGTRA